MIRSQTGRGVTGVFQASLKAFSTQASSRHAHRLTSASPYIRSVGEPSTAALVGKEEDFLYFPDFFEEAEQEMLLKLALWKLDRVDSSRRRRRRRKNTTTEGVADVPSSKTGLQTLFEDASAYGFEDVSRRLFSRRKRRKPRAHSDALALMS